MADFLKRKKKKKKKKKKRKYSPNRDTIIKIKK